MDVVIVVIISAVVLDLLIGDPRFFPHPVGGIAAVACWLERISQKVSRGQASVQAAAGFVTAVGVHLLVLLLSVSLVQQVQAFSDLCGALVAVVLVYFSIASKDLRLHSAHVYQALDPLDITLARKRVAQIVGRDTNELDQSGVIRATIESVSESITDGIIAPLFWAGVGAVWFDLSGAAAGAMLYRSVNTLDSLFGYKTQRYRWFGWTAARLDDLFNILPARLAAVCLILACAFLPRTKLRSALRIWYRDASKHQSPNAGHTEAAMAGALQVRLGGTNTYAGQRKDGAVLGDCTQILVGEHILLANRLALSTQVLFLFIFLVPMVFFLS